MGRWGQIHFRRIGPRPPQIILLHESPLSSFVFEDVLDRLGDSVSAIAFDTPGYGMSDAPPSPASLSEYAEVILEASIALGGENLDVVGVHTGASIAISMAAQAPDGIVRSLVLCGVTLIPPQERTEMLANWAPDLRLEVGGGHLDWAWERYRRIYGDGAPPHMLNSAVAHLVQNYDRYNWAYNASIAFDPSDDLRRLEQPVLLLTPEYDLLAGGDRAAMTLLRLSEQRVLTGMVGQPHMRDPSRFAAEIATWASKMQQKTRNVDGATTGDPAHADSKNA